MTFGFLLTVCQENCAVRTMPAGSVILLTRKPVRSLPAALCTIMSIASKGRKMCLISLLVGGLAGKPVARNPRFSYFRYKVTLFFANKKAFAKKYLTLCSDFRLKATVYKQKCFTLLYNTT